MGLRWTAKLLGCINGAVLLLCVGCAKPAPTPVDPAVYKKAVAAEVSRYYPVAMADLKPDFDAQGVSFPPKEVTLLVFKQEKEMELWAKGSGQDSWHWVKNYSVLAASGGPGPKLKNQDRQVPEGVYQISVLNPHSLFHLSMELDYPNAFDRTYAAVDGRKNLGGEIFIHGSHYSIGCIAIGNQAIEDLFVLTSLTGMSNLRVIIAPNDLRYEAPIYSQAHPKWLPKLYAQLQMALEPFGGVGYNSNVVMARS